MAATALKCQGCSTDLAANATKCPNCGTAVPSADGAPATSGQTGWGTSVKQFSCDGCGAQMIFSATAQTLKCAYCGSTKVIEQAPPAGGKDTTIRPDYLVPFKIEKEKSGEIFRNWVASVWFAPGDLKQSAQAGPMRGVYLPYWCFDVQTSTWYDGEAGFDYQVDESYTATENGQSVTKVRKVTKTRWEKVWGWSNSQYENMLVCASKGVDRDLADTLEPFELKERVQYTPDFLAGWEAERYTVDQDMAWKEYAKKRVMEKEKSAVEAKIKRDKKCDRVQSVSLDTRFSNVASKHLLLPCYVSAYQYNNKTYKFMINGQTGKVRGERPYSAAKIAALVVTIIAAIVGLMLLLSMHGGGPVEPTRPDDFLSKATAKNSIQDTWVYGRATKLKPEQMVDKETSGVGSWYRFHVTTETATVQIVYGTAGGADIDCQILDQDGKEIGGGRSAGAWENVQLQGLKKDSYIYVRLYLYAGQTDLYDYKIRCAKGLQSPSTKW